MEKTLSEKIKSVVGSLRFWLLTFVAVIMILQAKGIIDDAVFNIIKTWLVAVFGVGTLDSIASKFGGNKQ
jgi:hypothetical protein